MKKLYILCGTFEQLKNTKIDKEGIYYAVPIGFIDHLDELRTYIEQIYHWAITYNKPPAGKNSPAIYLTNFKHNVYDCVYSHSHQTALSWMGMNTIQVCNGVLCLLGINFWVSNNGEIKQSIITDSVGLTDRFKVWYNNQLPESQSIQNYFKTEAVQLPSEEKAGEYLIRLEALKLSVKSYHNRPHIDADDITGRAVKFEKYLRNNK